MRGIAPQGISFLPSATPAPHRPPAAVPPGGYRHPPGLEFCERVRILDGGVRAAGGGGLAGEILFTVHVESPGNPAPPPPSHNPPSHQRHSTSLTLAIGWNLVYDCRGASVSIFRVHFSGAILTPFSRPPIKPSNRYSFSSGNERIFAEILKI